MVKEVLQLRSEHTASLYKVIVKHSPYGSAMLHAIVYRDFFLQARDGLAVASLEDGRIDQVLLCEIDANELLIARAFYGEYGIHTTEILDTLANICSSKTPQILNYAILIPVKNLVEFETAFNQSILSKEPLEIIQVKSGVRNTDKFIWDKCLAKNIPDEAMVIFKIGK